MDIPKRSNHVLIDGDVICYAVGFASQASEWSLGAKRFDAKKAANTYAAKIGAERDEIVVHITPEPIAFALSSAKRMVANITRDAKGETQDVILTGAGNFRDDIATIKPYKGQRSSPKPLHWGAIREYLEETHQAIVVEGEEADDYLSYTALEFGFTIATIDKDLDNTEGWHYNWGREKLWYQTVYQARQHFYLQLLTGDTTDNIPSLFQVTGVRCSAKIKAGLLSCADELSMYQYVYGVWDEALGRGKKKVEMSTTAILTEIGILLHMRRTEGEIWSPPK